MTLLCFYTSGAVWKVANFIKCTRVQRTWAIAFARVFTRQRNNLVTLQRRLHDVQVEHLCFFRPQNVPPRQSCLLDDSDFMNNAVVHDISSISPREYSSKLPTELCFIINVRKKKLLRYIASIIRKRIAYFRSTANFIGHSKKTMVQV